MNTSAGEAPSAQAPVTNVRILGKPDKESSGTVHIKHWTPQERLLRALKTFAIWFFIALLSVFIPILHFVLVPLALLLAFIFSFMAYGQSSVVLGGSGSCPFCSARLDIVRKPDRWPLDDICSSCSRHVRIEKA
ncbi:MAG: hypothetical protein J0M12_14085 [Deltaproteobacteria bacterium]|nr:hypothetical protein [Deltaproteobacteria bacterium]